MDLPESVHHVHPKAYTSVQLPSWQALFEGEDTGVEGPSFEMRHPYFDLRMLRFLLALPPLPWCRSKYLFRRAMRGALPGAILKRKKSSHPGDQVSRHVAGFGLKLCHPAPEYSLHKPKAIPDIPGKDQWVFDGHLRVRSLNTGCNTLKKECIILTWRLSPMDPIQKVSPQTKKAYKRPDIRVYGDLREITQSVGTKSPKTDHAGAPVCDK